MNIKMQSKLFHQLPTYIACASTLCLIASPVQAGTLHNNWNYAIDSYNDGVSGGQVGGGIFEFYGMAFREIGNQMIFAINTNLPLAGKADPNAVNGSISYGDLFLNFSGTDFKTANSNGDLFGIRFSPYNDSGVGLGVYSNVTAQNVTQTNSGFSDLTSYNNYVQSQGGTPSNGDLSATDPYFEQTGNYNILNSIASGTKIGDINFLSSAELITQGLDFAHFGATGSQTIAFSFDKSSLPIGGFIANFFAECANDGITLRGESQKVPEPSAMIGFVATALMFGIRKLGKLRLEIQD